MSDTPELKCSLAEAERRYRMVREEFFTALAVAEMEGGIRAMWKKVEPHLAGPDKSKAFGILSIAMAHAWKKGYEAALKPDAEPLLKFR